MRSPTSGGCYHTNNSKTCDDHNACTLGDACSGGVCQPGQTTLSCHDGRPCTDDSCNPALGCVFTNNDNNACSDDSLCTTNDHCSGGSCVGASVVCPDDADNCTTPTCRPSVGCTFDFNSHPCDDGNLCTILDQCSPTTGACAGTPRSCDDGNVCTDDSCNVATGGCVHLNNNLTCSDNNPCTLDDACSNGACSPGLSALDCNDHNPCTIDACTPFVGCTYTYNDHITCDDSSKCTVNDTCFNGVCGGVDISSTCPPSPQVCLTAVCKPNTGCGFNYNTALCDDTHPCTVNDQCSFGACLGSPRVCDNGNVCTDGYCDPAVGCYFVNNTDLCSESNVCTVGDRCSGGQCQSGAGQLSCPTNVCRVNPQCHPTLGCQYQFTTSPCDDGEACTINDTCSQGSCQGARRLCSGHGYCAYSVCNCEGTSFGVCLMAPNVSLSSPSPISHWLRRNMPPRPCFGPAWSPPPIHQMVPSWPGLWIKHLQACPSTLRLESSLGPAP